MVLLIAGALLVHCGCETTDYDPLLKQEQIRNLEKKVQELEAELETVRGQTVGAGDAGNVAAPIPAAPVVELTVEQIAAHKSAYSKLENAGAFLLRNDDDEVTELDLIDARYDNELLEQLRGATIERLSLTGNSNTDEETFEIISSFKSLKRLDFERAPATPEALTHLKSLPSLTFMQLARATMTAESFEVIATFPAIQQIRCSQTRVDDEFVAHLKDQPTIAALDFSDCPGVSDASLEVIATLPRIKFLKVWGDQITDEGMKAVGKMKTLQVIGLNDTAVTDQGIKHLSPLLELREIHIVRTAVGDEGMKIFAAMPRVRKLNLRDTKISDQGLATLATMKTLEDLDLSESNSPGVTDAAAAGEFAKMTSLKKLNVWSTRVSDESVEAIAKLEGLTSLNLDNTPVTDAGVAHLKQMPQLEWLHLGKTKVSNDSVPVLCDLTNLKYLNFTFTEIDNKGYDKLDAVLYDIGCELIGP